MGEQELRFKIRPDDERGEISGIEVSGSGSAVNGLLQTQLTCLEVVAETPFAGQHLRCRTIAHLTVVISALLDALPEELGRRAMAIANFQRLVGLTLPYMQAQLAAALSSTEDRNRAFRNAGDEYSYAYFAYGWWHHMPDNAPRPELVTVSV